MNLITIQMLRDKTERDWYDMGPIETNVVVDYLAELIPSQARLIIERFVPKRQQQQYAFYVTEEHNKKGYIHECKKS